MARSPGRGRCLDALHFEAEHDAPERAQEEGEEVRRQAAEEEKRGEDIGDAQHDERHRLGEPAICSSAIVASDPATIMM